MRKPVVIDTNVLVVANGGAQHTWACIAACGRRLKGIREDGQGILDYGREILNEYGRNQSMSGQPGIGFEFWKWLVNTKAGGGHCAWVTITRSAEGGYEEFPVHEGLKTFDPADRKFFAVAQAHGGSPPILQAVDSKWWGWKDLLAECGVEGDFLCADEVRLKFEKKIGGHV